MRVVAGRLGGRSFDSPHSNRTHPMSERMRGAIFNSLGDLYGLTVLDAYAGSGALAIEAMSRGAASALAVEQNKTAADVIQRNIIGLSLAGHLKVVRASIHGWSANNPDAQFDIMLCDPPYAEANASNIQKLLRHVKAGGIVVLSWPGRTDSPVLDGADLVREKFFGDAQAIFYRKRAT